MRLVTLLIMFFALKSWADCPSADSFQQVKAVADHAMGDSVTVINDGLRGAVVDSLWEFRLSTQQLSLKQSNPEAIREWYTNLINLQKVAYDKVHLANVFKNIADAKKYAVLGR